MVPEVESYLTHYKAIHREIRSILERMDSDQLNWNPMDKETNSPGVLITHILGAEQFRIHQVIAGIPVHRDRNSEFNVTEATPDQLLVRLSTLESGTEKILSALTEFALSEIREPVRETDQPESVRSLIVHIIGHSFLHLGHLGLTEQLYTAPNSK